ncbi:lantibiotic immunity ABC transporter MutE/EpiE family permease subunit [Clostridium oceanicum]|uniref:Lantibiotic immunity ABC transporter MutE/EpiE family permease subunit n=1 Tax=Clostridium oceanicum TaxID=1543 RepID=A0ABN1JHY9_9CLOT
MINMIQAENLKYKNTFSKKLFYIAPMYILIQILSFDDYVFTNSINWWSLCFMPFIIAILCSLSSLREKKSGNYRTLKSKDINLKKMWISKVLVMSFYTFLASLTFILYFLIFKLVRGSLLVILNQLFLAVFIIWLTTLILIPICLFLSESFGSFASVIVTCVGFIGGALVAPKSFWYLCPWSINVRLISPILKIHPNGELLKSGSSLLNPSVIPIGIIIAVVGFIILAILTSLWFAKKEAR